MLTLNAVSFHLSKVMRNEITPLNTYIIQYVGNKARRIYDEM